MPLSLPLCDGEEVKSSLYRGSLDKIFFSQTFFSVVTWSSFHCIMVASIPLLLFKLMVPLTVHDTGFWTNE